MARTPHSFPLKEHLKKKSIIDSLYADGLSVTVYPLRAVFMPLPPQEQQPRAVILVSVSKKRFRHAVDRNLVKRRMREAYRLSKPAFVEELERLNRYIAVAILYTDTKHNSTDFLKYKMQKLLKKIVEKQQEECEK